MRNHGTLTKWNSDRGFGFISPAQGSEELFVHISAFPRDRIPPRIGEVVSYEIEDGKDGKKQAVRIMRPGSQRASRPSQRHSPSNPRAGLVPTIASMLAIGAIGAIGYKAYEARQAEAQLAPVAQAKHAFASPSNEKFHCDGREYCSQMTSYEEAKFFLQHCPNVKMDGNNDGEPCEQQFGR